MIIVLLFAAVNSFQVALEYSSPLCLQVQGLKHSKLNFKYAISGANEDQVKFEFIHQKKGLIYTQSNLKEEKYQYDFEDSTDYKVCLISLDKRFKIASIELQVEKSEPKIASKDSIKDSMSIAKEAYTKMKDIVENTFIIHERIEVHNELLNNSNQKMFYSSVVKIGLFMLVLLFQIVFLTRKIKSMRTSIV